MSHKNRIKFRGPMHGFNIIELLVAMGLSLLLLAGVLTMFSSSRSTYEVNDRLARIEENGRFALDSIVRSVRASGYLGCAHSLADGVQAFSALNKPAGQDLVSNYEVFSVTGFDYVSAANWSPALDTGFVISPADGSDVLVLKQPRRDLEPVELTTSMTTKTDDLHISPVASGSGPFNNHQILLISSCSHRAYFEITNYSPTTGVIKHAALAAAGDGSYLGNSTNSLNWIYPGVDGGNEHSDQGNSTVISLQTVVYYVRAGTAGNGNSLWRRIDNGVAEELIEGVDNMQFKFGIDTSGDGLVDSYVDPKNVSDPNTIVAVSIALLLRSPDQYGTIDADSKNYDLFNDGVTDFTAPGDHRLRQIFTTTATVRNSAS